MIRVGREQDDADFAEYVDARWGSLVRAGVVLGYALPEAHDLAQETLLRCFVSWAKVRRADNVDAYVYRVLVNAFRASRRRRWVHEQPRADVDEDGAPHNLDSLGTDFEVRELLDTLSPQFREVIVLRVLADLSERDTARLLGIPPGTVKSRLSRAIEKLSGSPLLRELERNRHGHQ